MDAIKTVGIVSLSSGILGEPFVKHELDIGIRRLQEYGLSIKFMPHALRGLDYLREHPETVERRFCTSYDLKKLPEIFAYDGSADDVFRNVTFSMDTDWKLGLIGRNGKGKTTLLNLLMGKYEYQGSIATSVRFDYFPCACIGLSGRSASGSGRGSCWRFFLPRKMNSF